MSNSGHDLQERPVWATDEYIELCRADTDLQAHWQVRPGHVFYCGDQDLVFRVTDLSKYFGEEDSSFREDAMEDGHWDCDIYLPEPPDVRAERHRQLIEGGFAANVEEAGTLDKLFGPETPDSLRRLLEASIASTDPSALKPSSS